VRADGRERTVSAVLGSGSRGSVGRRSHRRYGTVQSLFASLSEPRPNVVRYIHTQADGKNEKGTDQEHTDQELSPSRHTRKTPESDEKFSLDVTTH
jgi:hypothetical protein